MTEPYRRGEWVTLHGQTGYTFMCTREPVSGPEVYVLWCHVGARGEVWADPHMVRSDDAAKFTD